MLQLLLLAAPSIAQDIFALIIVGLVVFAMVCIALVPVVLLALALFYEEIIALFFLCFAFAAALVAEIFGRIFPPKSQPPATGANPTAN